jgi:putative colanic acid biosysnthesis UDP-glucose lipid carrier transferase
VSIRGQIAEDTDWPQISGPIEVSIVESAAANNLRLVHTAASDALAENAPASPARSSNRLQRALKRSLDLSIAVPALILLAPIMALFAILIRIDSSGPALFFQRRLGVGGKPFEIVKFRTMSVLEDGENITQVRRDDKRVTSMGRWLRKSSLDELPQLINVIRGEMSLVGPRPHAVAHDRLFGVLIDNYQLRQSVKPGITGWAQVHGLRGETRTVDDMKERVAFDIWYARHASLALDLEILGRTPMEVLRQRNAY